MPRLPRQRYSDWQLDEPADQNAEAVRSIRDEMCIRIEKLNTEALPHS